jgi:hypothetical protein
MKKGVVLLLILTLVGAVFSIEGWAQSNTPTRTPDDEIPLMDLLIARPMGVIAGVAGAGLFIATLPFTIPTKSVHKASKILITDPMHFSFSRQFPDESLRYD